MPDSQAWLPADRLSAPPAPDLHDWLYVVQDGKVMIVDEFTGRLMPGRRWSDGLHQAVEAKEGVEIERETQTLATITLQNYFRMYDKLAGMTGTAETEEGEFFEIYKLDCIVVPTNVPVERIGAKETQLLEDAADEGSERPGPKSGPVDTR